MTNYIISSLTKFALNDVIFLMTNYPSLMYEIELKNNPDEFNEYLEIIKQHKIKNKSVLNFTEDFLDEFKEQKIRDYIFDFLFFFDYFRIGEKLYEVGSDFKSYSTFFKIVENTKYKICQEVNNFENLEECDYTIFKNPEKELFDIKLLVDQLKKI